MFKPLWLDEAVPKKSASPVWEPPPIPRWQPHNIYSNFTNLEYLGKVKGGTNYGSENMFRRLHPITSDLDITNLTKIAGDVFYMVKPTFDNVNATLNSLEQRPVLAPTSALQMDCLERSYEFFSNQYGHLYRDSIANPEEINEYINYDKSSGFTGTHSGFRYKRDLATDPDFDNWLMNNRHLDSVPIWSLSPKGEFKQRTDIEINKIRLFKIPPYDLLYEQIRFSKRVSLKFKLYKWSAYGFNPYRGGTHNLAEQLLTQPIRFFYDLSGWDKFVPLMRAYYDLVRKNSTIPEHLKKNFEWMVRNTVSCVFKSPFGDVFRQNYGNPSGSGATTRDNIAMHIILVASFLIEAYYIKFGKFPTESLLNAQVIRIFGDDIVGAVSEDFSHILEKDFLPHFFSRFGMKLKYCTVERNLSIEKMDFLGFKFKKVGDKYYPLYDIQRIATSAIYEGLDDGTNEPFISRAFTLMVMSYPSEHYKTFKLYFQSICDLYMKSSELEYSQTVHSYLALRNLPDSEINKFFTGNESCQNEKDFQFFLPLDCWSCM